MSCIKQRKKWFVFLIKKTMLTKISLLFFFEACRRSQSFTPDVRGGDDLVFVSRLQMFSKIKEKLKLRKKEKPVYKSRQWEIEEISEEFKYQPTECRKCDCEYGHEFENFTICQPCKLSGRSCLKKTVYEPEDKEYTLLFQTAKVPLAKAGSKASIGNPNFKLIKQRWIEDTCVTNINSNKQKQMTIRYVAKIGFDSSSKDVHIMPRKEFWGDVVSEFPHRMRPEKKLFENKKNKKTFGFVMFVSEPKQMPIVPLSVQNVKHFLPIQNKNENENKNKNENKNETPFTLSCIKPKEGKADCTYSSMQVVVDISCLGKEKKYKTFAKVLLKLQGVRRRVDKSAHSEQAWGLFIQSFHNNAIRMLKSDTVSLSANGIKWIIKDTFNVNPFVVENHLQFKPLRLNRAMHDDLRMKKGDVDDDFLSEYI